jgi:hypothetical protein
VACLLTLDQGQLPAADLASVAWDLVLVASLQEVEAEVLAELMVV